MSANNSSADNSSAAKTRPIGGATRVVGVLGWPVAHSASPAMHNAAFAALGLDWVYTAFPTPPENIAAAVAGVRALGLAGANVTVPHKERIPALCDRLTERAARLGAVNTLYFEDDGQTLCGDSTDGDGFLAALAHDGVAAGPDTRAVVLGAGGSARAVVDALAMAGAHVVVANRTLERAREVAARFGAGDAVPLNPDSLRHALADANLLVNTTAVGMHPNSDAMPDVPLDALHAGLFVADLIYNPWATKLLRAARDAGCRTQNGVEMLVRQGAASFVRWTGKTPDTELMRRAVRTVLGASDTA